MLEKYPDAPILITLDESERYDVAKLLIDTLGISSERIVFNFTLKTNRIKLDVEDILQQLSTPKAGDLLRQIMAWNHRWVAVLAHQNQVAAIERVDFIKEKMPFATFFIDQFAVIKSRSAEITHMDGQILDLGVYKGASTRKLSSIFPGKLIHGFDSFEGLPDDWSHALKGTFGDIKGNMPHGMPENVRLYKGYFEESLPQWLLENDNEPISLLRVDCDIYSSTKTIFDILHPLIVEGTWICFDELIGYRGYEHHEYKALTEFLESSGFTFEYVAFGLTYALGYLKK